MGTNISASKTEGPPLHRPLENKHGGICKCSHGFKKPQTQQMKFSITLMVGKSEVTQDCGFDTFFLLKTKYSASEEG